MVQCWANRRWVLENPVKPKSILEWGIHTRVSARSFLTNDGEQLTIQVGGCYLTRNELKQCLKILDFLEAEDKRLNGVK